MNPRKGLTALSASLAAGGVLLLVRRIMFDRLWSMKPANSKVAVDPTRLHDLGRWEAVAGGAARYLERWIASNGQLNPPPQLTAEAVSELLLRIRESASEDEKKRPVSRSWATGEPVSLDTSALHEYRVQLRDLEQRIADWALLTDAQQVRPNITIERAELLLKLFIELQQLAHQTNQATRHEEEAFAPVVQTGFSRSPAY